MSQNLILETKVVRHKLTGNLCRINLASFSEEYHEDIVLRKDGPTIEEYADEGYDPATYPPLGYAAVTEEEREAAAEEAEKQRLLDEEAKKKAENSQGLAGDQNEGGQGQGAATGAAGPGAGTTESENTSGDTGAGGTGTTVDTTPGSIATVNKKEAKALIAAASTPEELDILEKDERASIKNPDGRVGILEAIEARRIELKG